MSDLIAILADAYRQEERLRRDLACEGCGVREGCYHAEDCPVFLGRLAEHGETFEPETHRPCLVCGGPVVAGTNTPERQQDAEVYGAGKAYAVHRFCATLFTATYARQSRFCSPPRLAELVHG